MLLNSGGMDEPASSPLAPLPPPKRSEKDEVTGADANSKANMSRLSAADHRHARHPLPSATIFLPDSDAALTAAHELRPCPICDTSRRLLSVLASFLADALSVFLLFLRLAPSFLRSPRLPPTTALRTFAYQAIDRTKDQGPPTHMLCTVKRSSKDWRKESASEARGFGGWFGADSTESIKYLIANLSTKFFFPSFSSH